MDLSPEVIGALIVCIVVLVGLFVILNLDSTQQMPPRPHADYHLWQKLHKLKQNAPGILLLSAMIVGVALWYGEYWLSVLQARHLGPAEFLLYDPVSKNFLVPILFLGLFLTGYLLRVIYRVMLGSQGYAVYEYIDNSSAGINGWRTFNYLAILIVPFCIGAIVLNLYHYIVITPSHIVINPYYSFTEKRYNYADVKELAFVESNAKAPYRRVYPRSHFYIDFNDGTELDLQNMLYSASYAESKRILEFISQQAHLPINVFRRKTQ